MYKFSITLEKERVSSQFVNPSKIRPRWQVTLTTNELLTLFTQTSVTHSLSQHWLSSQRWLKSVVFFSKRVFSKSPLPEIPIDWSSRGRSWGDPLGRQVGMLTNKQVGVLTAAAVQAGHGVGCLNPPKLWRTPYSLFGPLREAISREKFSFLYIVQKAFDPLPPFVWTLCGEFLLKEF